MVKLLIIICRKFQHTSIVNNESERREREREREREKRERERERERERGAMQLKGRGKKKKAQLCSYIKEENIYTHHIVNPSRATMEEIVIAPWCYTISLTRLGLAKRKRKWIT